MTAVSAPGKVLLAGGYLILDREHTGLVFGLDARIHVIVKELPTADGVTLQEVVVKSPQFRYAVWRYGYHTAAEGGGLKVTQLNGGVPTQPNPFIETALAYALTYVSTHLHPAVAAPTEITILADNSYYSQGITASVENGDRFATFDTTIWDAHKTGLGSSAALVTSFMAAVLLHYLPSEAALSLSRPKSRSIIHNLAQIAHSTAQGKVGSGFDVASAVWGSCLYRRFTPSIIESLPELGNPHFANKLKSLVEESNTKWDTEILKDEIKMPSGLRLVMCDVDCGSQTPGMVKQVLHWRKENPSDARKLWTAIQGRINDLAAGLNALDGTNPSRDRTTEYRVLQEVLGNIRQDVREMSRLSKVPIEPIAQTKLLDACSKITGVIGGVTPGAGGFDACVLLVEDKRDVLEKLDWLLSSWNFAGSDALSATSGGTVRRLPVREDMDGLKAEKATAYGKWLS